MDWKEITAQAETVHVTKRYKVTTAQDQKLLEIESELNIPPSAIVRMALNCFLPKLRDENFKYGGISELWNTSKF